MTKLEPHRCDLCGELFYVPESSIHQLEIDRGNKNSVDWEICLECHEALLEWIVKMREKK